MTLNLRGDGLQRTDAYCSSDNIVGENGPWSDTVEGFHSFTKLLIVADRFHADNEGYCNGLTSFTDGCRADLSKQIHLRAHERNE